MLSTEKFDRLVSKELALKTQKFGSQVSDNETNKDSLIQSWIEHQNAEKRTPLPTTPNTINLNRNPMPNYEMEYRNEKSNHSKFIARQGFNKDLPIFTGEPTEWPNFIIQFEETTNMCEFSDRETMQRLQKCLKGKARDSVHALLNLPDQLNQVMSIFGDSVELIILSIK